MNSETTKISRAELLELVQEARMHRGGKALKYTTLDAFRETILEMMEYDVSLPIILRWLKDKHEVVMVPNTLRKYITKKIGRDVYDEYLQRNCWKKSRRVPKPSPQLPPPNAELPESQNQRSELGFDLKIPKPATFQRTQRD